MKTKTTQSSLAKILGVSRQVISYHMKNFDPPPLDDIQAWKEHLDVHGREGTASPKVKEAIGKTKLAILQQVLRDKERTNKIKDDEIYDAGEVNRFLRDLNVTYFTELMRLEHEYPVTLKGKDEIQVALEVQRQNQIIRDTVTERITNWKDNHKPKDKKKS